MKARGKKLAVLAAVVLAAVLLSNNVFAKNLTNTLGREIPKKMIQNLAMGIASENEGLKRSCIYFAGFYEINELVNPLINQLKKESNPGTRILIALALYKIGGAEAMQAVEKLAKNDSNEKVKRIGNAILNEFQMASNANITKK
jgi:HEAT repeat protein